METTGYGDIHNGCYGKAMAAMEIFEKCTVARLGCRVV